MLRKNLVMMVMVLSIFTWLAEKLDICEVSKEVNSIGGTQYVTETTKHPDGRVEVEKYTISDMSYEEYYEEKEER